MFRFQFCCCAQISNPAFIGLIRDGTHQVNVNVVKSCFSCAVISPEELIIVMNPSEDFQFSVIRGLQTDAEAVDAVFPVCLEFPVICGSGIYFDGDLGICLYGKFCSDRFLL